jgi:DNA primase
MASTVLICYDGDSSGQRASVRAAEVLLQQGYMPRIIHLPPGQDPDDYLTGRSGEAVLELAGKAPDPIRYALGLLGGWSSISGTQKKIRVVRRLTDIASSASEPVIRETLLKVISRETGYSLGTLQEELERKEDRSGRSSNPVTATNSSQLTRWDRRILESVLLSSQGLADPIVEFIEPEDLRSPEAAAIFTEIKRQSGSGLGDFQISRLDDSQRSVCAMIYSGGSGGMGPEDRQRLRNAVLKERLERERREMKRLLRSGETEDPLQLQQRIIEIEKRITDIRTGGGQL